MPDNRPNPVRPAPLRLLYVAVARRACVFDRRVVLYQAELPALVGRAGFEPATSPLEVVTDRIRSAVRLLDMRLTVTDDLAHRINSRPSALQSAPGVRRYAAAATTPPTTVRAHASSPAPASKAAASATLGVPTAAAVRSDRWPTSAPASSAAAKPRTRTPSSSAAASIPGSSARRSIVARHPTTAVPATARTAARIDSAAARGRAPTPTATRTGPPFAREPPASAAGSTVRIAVPPGRAARLATSGRLEGAAGPAVVMFDRIGLRR